MGEGASQPAPTGAETTQCGGAEAPSAVRPDRVSSAAVDATVDAAAAEIRTLATSTPLRFVNDVGQIILTRFYGGDPGLWRSRAVKIASLRCLAHLLADRRGLGASSLCRCVQIHLVLQRLGPPATWTPLSATHFRVTLALSDRDQEALLRQAQASGWTVRQLRTAVAAQADAPTRASATGPGQRRAVGRLERLTREVGGCLAELGDPAAVDPTARDQARDAMIRAIAELETSQHRLTALPHATHRLGAAPAREGRKSNRGAAETGVASTQHPPR